MSFKKFKVWDFLRRKVAIKRMMFGWKHCATIEVAEHLRKTNSRGWQRKVNDTISFYYKKKALVEDLSKF